MGLDGIWQDDFHHVAIVAAGGSGKATIASLQGSAEELVAVTQGPLRDPRGDRAGPIGDVSPRITTRSPIRPGGFGFTH